MSERQGQYDEAMYAFSKGDYGESIERLSALLAEDPDDFDARLALGMALYRRGDLPAAIAEGHKAEKLRPHEQLVHTSLSLFYMKAGNKAAAEHHGLQARIASWRADAQASEAGEQPNRAESDLQLARSTPAPVKLPGKFPEMPWKKPAGKPPN